MSPAFPQLTNVASSVLLFQVSVVLLLVYVGYQRYGSPLRNVPGPFLASVTPLWRLYRVLKGNWHLEIIELHQRYGAYSLELRDVFLTPSAGEWVRIAPNEVSSISPSLVQTAYSHSGAAWPKVSTLSRLINMYSNRISGRLVPHLVRPRRRRLARLLLRHLRVRAPRPTAARLQSIQHVVPPRHGTIHRSPHHLLRLVHDATRRHRRRHG